MTQKAKITKEKIDKLDYIEIINFCASKDTINRAKKTNGMKKIFTNYIFDKEIITNKKYRLNMDKRLK